MSTSFVVMNIVKEKLQMENILQMEKDFKSFLLGAFTPPKVEKMGDVYHIH